MEFEQKLIEYLSTRPAINTTAIEKDAELPNRIITAVKLGRRNFTDEQKLRLVKALKIYGWEE